MKEQDERFDGWRKSIVSLVEMDEKITLRREPPNRFRHAYST